MFDLTTVEGRILAAALACAAKKSWAEVGLLDIAESANLPLSELRGAFSTKNDIIAALLRAVDDEVLKRAAKRAEGQEKRDLLFDVIMTRFDVLGPHKVALRSIYASGPADFALAGPFLSSQHWMLEAAGIGASGPRGALRAQGAAFMFARVLSVWIDDEEKGLDRTMAALDRGLSSAERWAGFLYDLCAIPCALRGRRRRQRARDEEAEAA